MKNKILFTVICLLCLSVPANAQCDTLHRCPFLYCPHLGEAGLPHGDTMCYLQQGMGLIKFLGYTDASWSPYVDNVTKFALYQHCEDVLHAIGIACGENEACGNFHYWLGLYDSTMELLRFSIPTNHHTIAFDSSFYFFCLPGYWNSYYYHPWYHGYHADDVFLQFAMFDEPVDISGDFYISFGKAPDNDDPPRIPGLYVLSEMSPPYYLGEYPIKVFRDDTKTWVDDTMVHEIPELFLIIEPECHGAENISVATDSSGCVHVEWDTLRWQEQWVLRLDGPGGTRYDTVDTCFHTYCGLDLNRHYEVSIQTQCWYPGGHNWSSWSAPATIGVVGIPEIETPNPTIEIYPNPATEQVEVTSSLPMARIVATDALGHRLLDRPATGLKATLDVSRWPAGAYLLQVHTATGIASRKLLVQ